jgi:hypothetical protein
MKLNLNQFFPKKEPEDFLVIDVGLQKLTAAVFRPDSSVPKLMGLGKRAEMTTENSFDLLAETLKSVEAIVTKLPKKVLLGVSGVGTKTATIVAKVNRQDPNRVVTEEELQEILMRSQGAQSPLSDSEKGEYKLFFSSVVWANIDGAKITNPVGSKGSEMEVSCFHAYKKSADLEAWDQRLTDSGFSIQKVVPTAFALSKIIIRNGIQSLILIRISEHVTEVSFITDTNIAEIATFDIGYGDLKLWTQAISILFAEVKLPKGLPDVIWVYPEGKEEVGERVRTKLLDINWKTDFKREIPNVKLGQKPEGFSAEDTPLISLGMEGINGTA